jgi:hypothetical protein
MGVFKLLGSPDLGACVLFEDFLVVSTEIFFFEEALLVLLLELPKIEEKIDFLLEVA